MVSKDVIDDPPGLCSFEPVHVQVLGKGDQAFHKVQPRPRAQVAGSSGMAAPYPCPRALRLRSLGARRTGSHDRTPQVAGALWSTSG
jgi:hypothetical protein